MNGKIGLTELIFIMAIVLLIFGPSKIGQLGKSLGEGIRNFKSSVKEEGRRKKKKSLSTPAPYCNLLSRQHSIDQRYR